MNQVKFYCCVAVVLFRATAALFAGETLRNSDLLKNLPRHNTIAGVFDLKSIRQNARLSQLLAQKNILPVPLSDFDDIAISMDASGRRFSAVLRFSSEDIQKKYFKKYSGKLLREKDHYTIINSGKDLNGAKIFLIQPDTILFYHDYPENTTVFDRSGICGETLTLLDLQQKHPVRFGGTMKFKKEPFRSIRSFNIFLSKNKNKIHLHGTASCRKPVNASLTHMAMLGFFSMYLQEYCNLSPENAGKIVALLQVRQHGKNLYFQLDDVEQTIARIIKLQAETIEKNGVIQY